jgi:hypothetical protein
LISIDLPSFAGPALIGKWAWTSLILYRKPYTDDYYLLNWHSERNHCTDPLTCKWGELAGGTYLGCALDHVANKWAHGSDTAGLLVLAEPHAEADEAAGLILGVKLEVFDLNCDMR